MITIHQIDKKQIILKSAEFLINYLCLYHNITQKTLLLLSGGSVVELYKPLADFIRKSNLDWKFLTIAQVDERFQPGQKTKNKKQKTKKVDEINADKIGQIGLWKECNKKKIPFYIISQEGSLKSSTDDYCLFMERLFKENVYKIAVMGIGEDGHMAGLLPGYESIWNTVNLVAGYENSGRFKQRISITPKAIKLLDQVIVVASGEKKREVIEHLTLYKKQRTKNKEQDIKKKELDEFPAIILREIPQVDLFTDLSVEHFSKDQIQVNL